jgi:hypothetical protein
MIIKNITIRKNISPYSAAITGCGFMYVEMGELLPMLSSIDRDQILRQEVKNGKVLKMKSEVTRDKAVLEFKRRYDAVHPAFWEWYQTLNDKSKRIAMFYVILKTYRICFDIQFNVVIPRWNSIERSVTRNDILMEFNEIAAKDEFVDSWSEQTKNKIASSCLSVLRKAGLLDEKTTVLQSIDSSEIDFSYYITVGETWFLEACLMKPYEIEQIKKLML